MYHFTECSSALEFTIDYLLRRTLVPLYLYPVRYLFAYSPFVRLMKGGLVSLIRFVPTNCGEELKATKTHIIVTIIVVYSTTLVQIIIFPQVWRSSNNWILKPVDIRIFISLTEATTFRPLYPSFYMYLGQKSTPLTAEVQHITFSTLTNDQLFKFENRKTPAIDPRPSCSTIRFIVN